MMKHYFSMNRKGYEVIFRGNSLESIKEIDPLGSKAQFDIEGFEEWTEEHKIIVKKAVELLF